MVNVVNFEFTGAYTPDDLASLAATADVLVDSGYMPLVSSGTDYNGVDVRGLENENDYVRSSVVHAGPGTAVGAAVNSNASLCVTLRSATTGRSARGRFYALPSVVGNLSAADYYLAAYGNDLVEFLNDLKTGAAAENWTMVVLSRWHNGAKRATAVTFPVVSIMFRNLAIDSQRRRLPAGH
jgi:hypothetical protein